MSRADVLAGRAHVSIYARRDQLTRGLQAARADVNKFGSDMIRLGAQVVAATAAIGAPVAFATKTFADFDDAMRAVGAVSQATAAELQSMTDVAKMLGATTSFTAVQVAQLMTELGRAGFKPDQVNAMTGAVMDLARATGTDATLASGIMAASIRQFSLGADDATRVADVLTKAANATFNSVESLGEALKYAGPVAAELGLSLEDTVAILGTLGNVGIQGSEAGTSLRRLGVISAATGEKLKDIFNINNVDATGELKPLVQIMDEIGKAIENLPAADKVTKMNEAFGLLGITSASVLARTAGSTADLARELKNAEGTASKAAKSMDSGLGGAFRIILSAVEGLQIALGKALSGSIQAVTNSITSLIGRATEWVAANEGAVVTVAAMTVAVASFGASLIAVGVSAKVMAVAIAASITVINAVKSTVLIAAAAIKLFGVVSMAVGTAMYVFSSSVAIVNGLGIASAAVAGAMASAWSTAAAVISGAWAVITAPVFPFLVAAGAIVTVIGGITAAATIATVRAMDFSAAWTIAKDTLSAVIGIAKQVGGILMTALQQGDYDIAFKSAMAGVKLALATTIDAMGGMWETFWSGAWKAAQTFMKNFVEMSMNVVKAVAEALANPTTGAAKLGWTLSQLTKDVGISFSIDTKGMKGKATEELAKLEKELADRQAKRDAENKAKADAEAAAGAGDTSPGASGEGSAFGDQTSAQMDGAEAAEEAKTAFDRETESIRQQIIALREGEEAAERFRLSKQGLTDAEIEQVMALRKEQEALQEEQENARRIVERIQDYADAEYANKDNQLSSAEIASKEQDALMRNFQSGKIDTATFDQAFAESKLREEQRDHQERLKKLRGEGVDAATSGASYGLKSGGASAATFSAQSLLSMGSGAGQGPQLRAMLETKRLIADQTKKQEEQSAAQIAAIKNSKMKHS
jgi:TP901 family phage tail tape measure protein